MNITLWLAVSLGVIQNVAPSVGHRKGPSFPGICDPAVVGMTAGPSEKFASPWEKHFYERTPRHPDDRREEGP
ncbi:MAG: hypothetical protein SF052_00185 [Bacteroidia bacterium]|nr:hypothetical protein [Bacteroidia bacterium]